MDIASFGLSLIATIGGGFLFWFYDRKLKKLELRQAERNDLDATSADVIVDLHAEKGNNCLVVRNAGRVPARNVSVSIEPDIRSMPRQFPFPMTMESGQTVNVSILRSVGGPERTVVTVSWNDEARPNGVTKVFDTPLFS